MLIDIIKQNRSYRRFDTNNQVKMETLHKLVMHARFAPSSRNIQALKFYLSNTNKNNELIFNELAWAGYLKDWDGPDTNERPTAYIIILGDTNIAKSFNTDTGIAAQSLLLAAVEQGLGGCMIGSINKKALHRKLKLSPNLEIQLVIALGKPVEKVILEDVKPDGDIKYYRDAENNHHVPKRTLDELIVN